MPVHTCIIAIAAVGIASAASGEPSKSPVSKAARPSQAPATMLAAAASKPVAPAATAETQGPAINTRVRTARISACRCGGQTPTEN